MLQPGTILLEKYRVERLLGKGGMGFVLAARHVHLGELFAIKTMLPDAVQKPEALERFLREARACAKLKGEHVARVHDIGKLADGTPYMLMEHLDGEDLGQILGRRKTLPVDEAALYIHQACEAVAEAHAYGIVHRDLKPSNLFLTHRPNGTPCVKVLDFGISKDLDETNKIGANLTKTGTFLGSPMYMSPEQMVDLKTTDARGDVWALGVILYEFVTGQPPFASDLVTAVVSKVLLAHPEPPSRMCEGIPPEFDAVVMRCLEKTPDLRYSSASELKIALEPFAGILPAPISPTASRSGMIPRSVIIPSVEMAETVESSAVPVIVTAKTLASSISVPRAAIAETIPGDPLPSAMSNESVPSIIESPSARVPVETESSLDNDSPPSSSIIDSPTICPVEGEASGASDKPTQTLDSNTRRKLIRASAALGACVLLGMILVWGKTSAPTPISASEAPSAKPEDPPAPTEASSNSPNDAAAPAPTQSADAPSSLPKTSAAPRGQSTRPAASAPTNRSPSPAPTSRRTTGKKSRIPNYDD